jgi:hypothetical protein
MKTKINEWVISTVRTVIAPFVGAWIISILLKWGIDFKPNATFWSALNFLIMGVWYVVFRGIEILAKNPKIQKWAGIFLGYPRVEVPKP